LWNNTVEIFWYKVNMARALRSYLLATHCNMGENK